MLKSGKPVQSIWLGGEKFDKIATKLKSYIGTQVYVQTTTNITDLEISRDSRMQILNIKPDKDGYVSVVKVIWDGDSSVDLIGSVDADYTVTDNVSTSDEVHTDLCIIDTESI